MGRDCERNRLPLRWIALLLLVACDWCHACCPNSCNGHGQCSNQGNGCICNCFKGYHGGDCSRRLCPVGPSWSDVAVATDRAHLPIECSGRGTCDFTVGKCTCDAGFTGLSCNRLSCPNDCSKHGECRSIKYNAFRKDPGLGPPVTYTLPWDTEMVYGCICDDGFEGGDCSRKTCATGDDPLTSTDSTGAVQKNEKQTITCRATSGTFTLSYRGQTTVPINYNDKADIASTKINALSTLKKVNVFYPGTSTTFCGADEVLVTIEFTQNFGSLPLLVGDPSKLDHAVAGMKKLVVSKTEAGTKENDMCSNRGRCDQTSGICNCFAGYTTSNGAGGYGDRGDCGAATYSIVSCPGDTECSGKGYCSKSPSFRCSCIQGYTGGDCFIRTCPKGLAWFDLPIDNNRAHQYATCSGVGYCDTSKGECNCPTPFEGAACDRMKCPGGDNPCNGRGQCLTMAALAQKARVNGDPIFITYGATPNNPLTWDYNKIMGCLCDDGWEGHDCSLKSCPRGDNPRTVGQFREVQTILCQTNAVSSFLLSFRGLTTAPIPTTATVATVKSALEALSTVGIVTVVFSTGSTACTSNGANLMTIRFETRNGDLPALRFTPVNPAAFVQFTINTDGVAGSIMGTVENAVCSHNGLCDYSSGKCECFSGMASSDGRGNLGVNMDCGYIVPMVDPLAGVAANTG